MNALNTLAERMRALRIKQGLNQSQLARHAGTKPQVVQLIEAGKVLQSKHLFSIAHVLDTTAEWLLTGVSPRRENGKSARSGQLDDRTYAPAGYPGSPRSPQAGPDEVPIFAAESGKNGPKFSLNTHQAIGHVPRHPRQQGMHGAFAFYCAGDSMSPRYEHGDLIYCLPHQPLKADQDIVVTFLNDEHAVMGRMVKLDRAAQKLTLEQFNPPGKTSVSIPETVEIYTIVGRG